MGLIDGAQSGNVMDGVGQMLDPIGIFATGREGGVEGVIRNIFDPLGIFSGVGKGSAPPVEANQQVDQLFTPDTVVDLKGKDEEKADDKEDKDKDSTTVTAPPTPATTEIPAEDKASAKGYATSESDSPKKASSKPSQKPSSKPSSKPSASAQSTKEQRMQDAVEAREKQIKGESKKNGNTGTATATKPLKSGAPTAAASQARTQEEEMRECLKHLAAIRANIMHVSGSDSDAKFSMQNLHETVRDPNSTPGEKAAAQYLIDHEEIFSSLINLSNCGSGSASEVGVDKMIVALGQALAKPPPVENDPPIKNNPPVEKDPPVKDDETPPVGGSNDDGVGGTEKTPPSKPPKKSVGFEGAISNLDSHLNDMEAEMAKLTDQMIKGADPKATDKQKAEGSAAQSKLAMFNLRYQQFMNIRREMYELLSNVKKTYDDMSLRAIGNIR